MNAETRKRLDALVDSGAISGYRVENDGDTHFEYTATTFLDVSQIETTLDDLVTELRDQNVAVEYLADKDTVWITLQSRDEDNVVNVARGLGNFQLAMIVVNNSHDHL